MSVTDPEPARPIQPPGRSVEISKLLAAVTKCDDDEAEKFQARDWSGISKAVMSPGLAETLHTLSERIFYGHFSLLQAGVWNPAIAPDFLTGLREAGLGIGSTLDRVKDTLTGVWNEQANTGPAWIVAPIAGCESFGELLSIKSRPSFETLFPNWGEEFRAAAIAPFDDWRVNPSPWLGSLEESIRSLIENLRNSIIPGPGTLAGDLFAVTSRRDEADRRDAAYRLADRMGPGLRKPGVSRAARELAQVRQMSVRQVIRDELATAVVLAGSDSNRPQKIRFGTEWLVDDDGHQLVIAPDELPMEFCARWLFQRARAICVAGLLGTSAPGEDLSPLLEEDANDLAMALQIRRDYSEQITARLGALSEKQRAVYILSLVGVTSRNIAVQLDMSPVAVRQRLMEARRKLRAEGGNKVGLQGRDRSQERRGVGQHASVPDHLGRQAG